MADDQPREANVDTQRGEEQVVSSAPEGNGSINRSPSTNRKAKPEESMTHPKPDVAPSSSRAPSNGSEATNKRAKFTRGQSSGNNRSREASGGRGPDTSSSSKPQQVVVVHSPSVNNGRGRRQQQSSRNDEEEILTMSSDSSSHQDEQDHSDQYDSVEDDDSYSASQSQSESDDQRDDQREGRYGKRRHDESSEDASYDSASSQSDGSESHSDEEPAKEPIEDLSFVAKKHHWTASSKRNIKLFPLAYPIFVVVPKVIKPSWIKKLLNDELRTILQMPPFAVFYNVARKNDADFCRAITSNIFALPLFGVPTLGVDSRYANGLISNMSIEKLAPLSSVSPYTATSDRYSYLVFIDAALYKMVPQKDWVKSECPVIDISESKHVTTKKQTEEDRDAKRSKRATHQEQPSSKKRSDEKRTSRPSKDESSEDDREERRKQPSKSDKQPSKRSSPTPDAPTRKPSASPNASKKPKSDNRQAKTSGKASSVKRDTTSHPSIASTFFVNDESSSSSNDDAGVFDMVVKTPATRSGNTNGKSKQAPTSPSHKKSRDDQPSEHRSNKKRPTSEPRKSRQQDAGNGRTQERPSGRKQDESKGARPQPHQERQSKSTSNRRN
jgi:hypothetical protein